MDSKRRFKLRGQTVPDNPTPTKDPLTGKKSKGRRMRLSTAEIELDLVPFHTISGSAANSRDLIDQYGVELRNQMRRQHHTGSAEWAVDAIADAMGWRENSVLHRMFLREMGIVEADDVVVSTPDTSNISFDPAQGSVTIPEGMVAGMSVESNAERMLQNMVRQGLTYQQMVETANNINSAGDAWTTVGQASLIHGALMERIRLYWAVVGIADIREQGGNPTPQQIMQNILRAQQQSRQDANISAAIANHTRTAPIPRRLAPRQVDPVVRNAARPRAAPRGGVPPAMFQRSENRLERQMLQFESECNDLRDQCISLTNAGRAEDAQNILNQFHAYRADIGSFPENGGWRARAQAFYDECWNRMFANRMRYDSSRGVRRINRRKP